MLKQALGATTFQSRPNYRWKKKYGAMSTDEAKRLKEVERENAKLKRIVAEQTLIIDGLREISSKNC